MIKIENISKKFIIKNNIVQALEKINLLIKKNDCCAIVGESGSGKTTLANIILGIYKQDQGSLWLNDIKLTNHRNISHRKIIQYVQQNPMSTLNPKKTIRSTLALPLKIHNIVKHNEIDSKINELLSYVGLDSEYMTRYPDTLSGGQKQRVAIARAMASKPKVLLADEPTGALDSKTSKEVMALIQQINKSGKTILIVTHEEDIAKMCSRIVRLKDGVIMEDKKNKMISAI